MVRRFMRLRTAKRLGINLKRRGLIKNDPFYLLRVLVPHQIIYIKVRRIYLLIVNLGGVAVYREHPCPFQLVLGFSEYLDNDYVFYQGRMCTLKGSIALANYLDRVVPSELRLEVTTTYKLYPTELRHTEKFAVMQAPLDRWAEKHNLDFSGFMNSRDVEEPGLRVEALTQLFEYPEPPSDEDDANEILMMFLALSVVTPFEVSVKGKLTIEDLMMQPITKSSAGAVCLEPAGGAYMGSKEEMVSSAAEVGIRSTQLINSVAIPKAEVIKKGKKIRQIIADSLVIYQKDSFFFNHIVRVHGRVVDTDCNGLSKVDGNFMKIFYSMYLDEKEFNSDITWVGFLDLLEKEGLDEDDKQKWEARVGRNRNIASLIHDMVQVQHHPDDYDHMAQVLSHSMGPVIKFKDHTAYFAKWKVASGKFKTLQGNVKGHLAGVQRVAQVIQEHDMLWGKVGCECKYCEVLKTSEFFGEEVTFYDLHKITGGGILGDDRIRRAFRGEEIGKLVDVALRTHTIFAHKEAFEDAEFLKTRFRRTGDKVTVYRPEGRVFAKLYHGDAKHRVDHFLSALVSASMELGDNQKANEVLQDLYEMCGFTSKDQYRDVSMNVYEGVMQGDPLRPFTYDEVMLKTYGDEAPFYAMVSAWERAVNELN